jgi:hypothetical protein
MRDITIEQQQAATSSGEELVAKCRQSDDVGCKRWSRRCGMESVNTAVKRKELELGIETESKILCRAARLPNAQIPE